MHAVLYGAFLALHTDGDTRRHGSSNLRHPTEMLLINCHQLCIALLLGNQPIDQSLTDNDLRKDWPIAYKLKNELKLRD